MASLQNLRRLAHEALARSSSSGTTPLALSPRDVAQALTGMALLGPTLWAGDDASIAPEQVAATATALAAMVARRQRPTTSEEEEIWGPQEVVGLAEGAAALAAALPPPSASVAANGAWLALEGLVQALLARAGGGAACRGPVPKPNKCGRHWEKGGKTPAAVVRLWRPRDRRRVAAALSALLPSPSLRPPAPSITTAAAAGGGGGAPERWLLRARVRTASSVAAIQALLLLHAAPAASSSSSPVVIDGVALAMAVQRLGRLCASQREQQASTRAWLLPYITSPSVAAAVAGMDGRALASFVDGVAMLLPSGSDALRDKNGGGFLAAAVDAAMARALLPDTNEESEDGLPPWLLAPDAARLVPALVKLDYGTHSSNNNNTDTDAISSHHRPLLLHLAYRRAAAGASALPLPIVARLLYAASTTITDNNASSLSVVASAALLQRGAELLFSLPSQARNTRKPSCPCPKDVGNLVSAAAALLAHATAGDKAIIQEPLAALARGALAWEAARPVPDPTMTALDLAKLLRGLSRLFHKEKAAVVAVATAAVKTRWLARARAVLPDARLRALAAVASALAAVSVVEGEEGDEGYREALRAFVADARRRLPALVAAAAKGRDDAGGQQAEGEVVAALAVLEAAAEEGDCEQ